jgi:hypothetical protein
MAANTIPCNRFSQEVYFAHWLQVTPSANQFSHRKSSSRKLFLREVDHEEDNPLFLPVFNRRLYNFFYCRMRRRAAWRGFSCQTDQPSHRIKTASRVDVPSWIGSEKRNFLSGDPSPPKYTHHGIASIPVFRGGTTGTEDVSVSSRFARFRTKYSRESFDTAERDTGRTNRMHAAEAVNGISKGRTGAWPRWTAPAGRVRERGQDVVRRHPVFGRTRRKEDR